MADIVVSGNSSGSVTLRAPDVSGTTILTLPTTSGTLVTTAGGSTVPFALGSAAAPSITFTGDTNTGIFSPGADSIGFAEGGAEIARFDSSGNFGIGTASPARRLDVRGGLGMQVNEDGAGTKVISFRSDFAGVGPAINVTTNDPLLFLTNNTERMRIASNGTVGIGTTTTTDAGLTITPSTVRDGGWNAKLALQSTGAGDYPALLFSGCFNTNRYGTILQTASTSGDTSNQVTARIDFLNTSATAGNIVFCTNNAVGTGPAVERMRILATGNILSLAGGSTTATGTGIAFPATQSASSDANTLDDYEEGTFTPTITTGVTSPTYAIQIGWYTKIGNTVYITGRIELSGGTTNTSVVAIGNLPFQVFAGTGQVFPVGACYLSTGVAIPTGGVIPIPLQAGTSAELYSQGATGLTAFIGTNSGNLANIDFQFYYRVN